MAGADRGLIADLIEGYGTDVDESARCLTPRMALRLIVQAQLVADLSARSRRQA